MLQGFIEPQRLRKPDSRKGARNKPLSEASKEPSRIKSAIRVCVEHVFGRMTISMGGKATRKIGVARTVEAWWGGVCGGGGLKNLTYILFRYLQRTYSLAAVASL